MTGGLVAPARRSGLGEAPARWLSCIRFDEVMVLQGAPLLGALFAIGSLTADRIATLALLVAGNLCLVSHVFVLNDWAGLEGDLRDPRRAARTFAARGASPAEAGLVAAALLALALLLFGLAGTAPLVIALGIAALSALYSLPAIHGKGIPLFSSALHLAGGVLHVLLGYAAFAPVTWHGLVIAGYFGLLFAAGHLTHEARDHDGDALGGIRTNAVAFGPRRSVLAGLALFSLAYALLAAMALMRVVPFALVFAVLLYPVQVWATWRALRAGPTFDSLSRLQSVYRRLHAAIGLAMLVTVPPW